MKYIVTETFQANPFIEGDHYSPAVEARKPKTFNKGEIIEVRQTVNFALQKQLVTSDNYNVTGKPISIINQAIIDQKDNNPVLANQAQINKKLSPAKLIFIVVIAVIILRVLKLI